MSEPEPPPLYVALYDHYTTERLSDYLPCWHRSGSRSIEPLPPRAIDRYIMGVFSRPTFRDSGTEHMVPVQHTDVPVWLRAGCTLEVSWSITAQHPLVTPDWWLLWLDEGGV